LCRHSAISRASEGIVLDETGTTPDHLADQAVLVDWLRANVPPGPAAWDGPMIPTRWWTLKAG
jgi:hypothetical protein